MSDRVTSTPPENLAETSAEAGAAIKITVFKKHDGILSKTIRAGEDGSPASDGSACRMSSGTAMRVTLSGADALADLVNNMAPNEALAHWPSRACCRRIGACHHVRRLKTAFKGTIARSRDFIEFKPGAPAFMLLISTSRACRRKSRIESMRPASRRTSHPELFPELMKAAPVWCARRLPRASPTPATGQTFPGSGGMHIYVLVEDGSDIPRALEDLCERLWLNGCGSIHVGAVGQELLRTLATSPSARPKNSFSRVRP